MSEMCFAQEQAPPAPTVSASEGGRVMKADVIRAHEVEQGMFERNYTSFTLRCKRYRGFSLHSSAPRA